MTVIYVWVMILVGGANQPAVLGGDQRVNFLNEETCRKFLAPTERNLGFQKHLFVIDCVQVPLVTLPTTNPPQKK